MMQYYKMWVKSCKQLAIVTKTINGNRSFLQGLLIFKRSLKVNPCSEVIRSWLKDAFAWKYHEVIIIINQTEV